MTRTASKTTGKTTRTASAGKPARKSAAGKPAKTAAERSAEEIAAIAACRKRGAGPLPTEEAGPARSVRFIATGVDGGGAQGVFALVVGALLGETPIEDIPLAAEIARQTIAANQRR